MKGTQKTKKRQFSLREHKKRKKLRRKMVLVLVNGRRQTGSSMLHDPAVVGFDMYSGPQAAGHEMPPGQHEQRVKTCKILHMQKACCLRDGRTKKGRANQDRSAPYPPPGTTFHNAVKTKSIIPVGTPQHLAASQRLGGIPQGVHLSYSFYGTRGMYGGGYLPPTRAGVNVYVCGKPRPIVCDAPPPNPSRPTPLASFLSRLPKSMTVPWPEANTMRMMSDGIDDAKPEGTPYRRVLLAHTKRIIIPRVQPILSLKLIYMSIDWWARTGRRTGGPKDFTRFFAFGIVAKDVLLCVAFTEGSAVSPDVWSPGVRVRGLFTCSRRGKTLGIPKSGSKDKTSRRANDLMIETLD